MILSFTTSIDYSIPQPVLCLLFVAVSVMVSRLGLKVFNVWAEKQKLEFSNEVAGIVFGGISLIYSLVLAFVIAAVWDDYKDLGKTIEAEADKLNSILIHTNALPDSIRVNVQQTIYNYCDEVINGEWQMNDSKAIMKTSSVHSLREQLLNTEAQNKIQQNILSVVDTDLATLSDLRRERLNHSHSQIPAMIWFILDAGSIMLIIFFFFLNVPSLKLKKIYLSIFVSAVAACMFLLYTLDHPFSNVNGVSSELYQNIQSQLKDIDNSPPG